jgi:hypothetical protein
VTDGDDDRCGLLDEEELTVADGAGVDVDGSPASVPTSLGDSARA